MSDVLPIVVVYAQVPIVIRSITNTTALQSSDQNSIKCIGFLSHHATEHVATLTTEI